MNSTDQGQPAGSKAGETTNKGIKGFLKNHNFNVNWDDAQTMKALKIAGLVLLSLLSVFVIVKTVSEIKAFTTIGEIPSTPYVITVTGKAELQATKDIASISFTATGKGTTAGEAQSIAAEANNKAIDFVKSKGVSEKDITTENYNTYPVYEQKVRACPVESATVSSAPAGITKSIAPIPPCSNYESVIVGYETTQTVRIKIRGIDKSPDLSGEIITGLGSAGVQVGNLQMTIDNPDELKKQARMQAIMDARRQAKDIARAMGGRLGRATSYYDNDMYYPYSESAMSMDARMTKEAVSPEIYAGEGKVTANVSVTFELR